MVCDTKEKTTDSVMFFSIPGKEVTGRAEGVLEDPLEGAEGVTEDTADILHETTDRPLYLQS